MPVQCPYNGTDIKQSSCGNLMATALVIIVWPPYDVCQYLSKLVSLSYVQMFCFTRLKFHLNKELVVYVWYTNFQKYKSIKQPPYDLRTEASRAPCYILAISMHGCGDSTMTARSPHGLSTALHGSVVETRQRNRTMAV